MGWCVDCGTKTRGRTHQCVLCKKREKLRKYKAPKVSLTTKEKENLEKLRLAYNPGYAFEKYFQEVMNSVM